MRDVEIKTEYIKLDAFLKFAGIFMSGGEAKAAVENGEARVNGEACQMRGKKLRDGDTVECRGETLRIVRKA